MADLGHGAAITFASGFLAPITNINWSGMSRTAVDTTTFSTTGGKTKIPSDTYDPGTLSVTMQTPASGNIPLASAAETVTLTFPDGNNTISASGFMTGFTITLEDEGVITSEAEVTLSGNITGNLTIV